MPTILIASTNPGKLREFQEILAGEDFNLVLPTTLGIQLQVVEDGSTYAENAAKKALAYQRASGLVTLADDSGLEVDALGGAPGLYSARYSPLPGATDADRRAHLLDNLRRLPRPWPARFHCTVAVAAPGGVLELTEGKCPGEIIPEERGSNGFGYDPIFLLAERGLTMAELDSEDKNRISHRALAVLAALPILYRLPGRSG
ncbi:MAG TPA: RdgB/HAM1 family non-canonical purine NTP pyrophosphatase [Anaerolinea sp.]|nr:RdgB/HAM1 family non-canonical purine NTP pyrophosphatase [Anaerolinea sp.]